MAGRIQLAVLLAITLASAPSIHGLVLTNDNTPSLIDRFLQLIWEPQSLIRMWVGLDQLYNIALSWRTVAKKLATLPFNEGRSMDHVKIQEPRSFKYRKPSVASQLDRFNEIYASSSLSPIVAHARSRQVYRQRPGNALGGHLQPFESYAHIFQVNPNSAVVGLPPTFLFQPQEVFLNPESTDLSQSANELAHSTPFAGEGDSLLVAKLLELQKLENQKILQNRRYFSQLGGVASSNPEEAGDPNSVLGAGSQERLNKLLKLLKTLGDMHTNDVDGLQYSDS